VPEGTFTGKKSASRPLSRKVFAILSAAGRGREDIAGNIGAARLHRVPADGRRKRTANVASHARHRYDNWNCNDMYVFSLAAWLLCSSADVMGECFLRLALNKPVNLDHLTLTTWTSLETEIASCLKQI